MAHRGVAAIAGIAGRFPCCCRAAPADRRAGGSRACGRGRRRRRRRRRLRHGTASSGLGGLLSDQVVVVDELVAIVDEQIRGRILDAHADDRLVVLAQLADQRREIRIAADNDERIDVPLGVAQVQRIDDHADVRGILARLAYVRDLDQLEGRLVQAAFELLVTVEVAVRLFDHDVPLEQQPLEHLLDIEARIAGIPGAQGDIFKIQKHRHGGVGSSGIGSICHLSPRHLFRRRRIRGSGNWAQGYASRPTRRTIDAVPCLYQRPGVCMQYRPLGRTGLLVSEVCLGTMTFAGRGFWKVVGTLDLPAATELVERSLGAGVNFIDTADVYAEGESERLLGLALRNLAVRREDVVLATKVRGRTGAGPNDVGLTRKHILASVEARLRRLQTDYIDLYQIHGYDPLTPLEETLRALDNLVSRGLVRYVGCSNLAAWQLMKALGLAEREHLARFESLQAYYSIASRDLEREIVPLLQDQGVGLLVWSPLSGGLLSGKFSRGS